MAFIIVSKNSRRLSIVLSEKVLNTDLWGNSFRSGRDCRACELVERGMRNAVYEGIIKDFELAKSPPCCDDLSLEV